MCDSGGKVAILSTLSFLRSTVLIKWRIQQSAMVSRRVFLLVGVPVNGFSKASRISMVHYGYLMCSRGEIAIISSLRFCERNFNNCFVRSL